MNILDEIKNHAYKRAEESKKNISCEQMKKRAYSLPKGDFSFEKSLKKPGLSFICEVKKASPSKGVIDEEFPYIKIAREYEKAGADCISVLTEPKWFMGKDIYLKEISESVKIPSLKKDFIVDEYMIYQGKISKASAVLLIASILSKEEIKKYIQICDDLGISTLVEAHNEDEIEKALSQGARIIGVNNRNLKDFSVDFDNSLRLRKLIPDDIVFVSESGIKNRKDIEKLEEIGVDAVLIGETLMKSSDKAKKLRELKYD